MYEKLNKQTFISCAFHFCFVPFYAAFSLPESCTRYTFIWKSSDKQSFLNQRFFFSGTVRSSVLSYNRFNDTVQSKLGNNLYSRSNFILLFFNDYNFFSWSPRFTLVPFKRFAKDFKCIHRCHSGTNIQQYYNKYILIRFPSVRGERTILTNLDFAVILKHFPT